ncbi:MAG: hypothetical protein GF317_16220 [Candidatus Lokiarchaeota archaeon]|nr:hypothetical protein [Candidatus Lokiarchaeota archaeon]MBD3201080.1 hypothetical protein [Candidatus Lokiarchaeota archaeon]
MSNSEFEYIICDKINGKLFITLNRPHKLNALNYSMLMEVVHTLIKVKRDKSVRAIIIQGSGNDFCSGDDLETMGPKGLRFKPLKDGSQLPHQKVIRLLREIEKPVIALIQGYCFGAGFELALGCDFRIASDTLEIGDHRAKRGICVLCGASWLLPRIVGYGRALDIILTGRHLDAKEAYQIGLITRYYTSKEFEQKAIEYIDQIARMPTKCLGYNKAMINYSIRNELFPSLKNEFKLYCKNFATKDFREGVKSFLERREPKFIGK